jgi:hypothetical protein
MRHPWPDSPLAAARKSNSSHNQLVTVTLQAAGTRIAQFQAETGVTSSRSPGQPYRNLKIQGADMNTFIRYAAILGFTLASAQAQAVEFSFTSAGTITDPLTDLTITSSAWSKTAAGSQFEAAKLSFDTDGMGVYNPTENDKSKGQGNTTDALGNNKGVDLVLFSFSSAVSLQSLTMYQVGRDSDLSLWAGTGTFSPSGLQASSSLLGAERQFGNTNSTEGIRTVDLSAIIGTYDWLAVAARIDHTDDLVKLKSLTVTPVAQSVPEVETWVMLLAGLGLVGFAVRRRA